MDNIMEELSLFFSKEEREQLLKYIPDSTVDAKRLLDRAGSEDARPNTKFIKQEGKTNSEDHNKSFEDIFIDLYSLYLKSKKVYNNIENTKEKSMSALQEVRSKVQEVKEDLYKYEFIVNNDQGFTRSYYDLFRNEDKKEEYNNNMAMYVDPDTKRVVTKDEVGYIANNYGLTLSSLSELTPNHVTASKVNQSGKHLIADPDNVADPNIVFTSSDEQVWTENIMADQPFNLSFNEPSYYERSTGALCKLHITLDSNMPINYINLKPYSEFPFEITSIIAFDSVDTYRKYKSSNNLGLNGISIIVGPEDAVYEDFFIQDNEIISFPDISECKIIDLAIRQPNYKLERFFNIAEEVENIGIMNDLFKSKDLLISVDDNHNSIIDLDYSNRNKMWLKFDSVFSNLFNNIYAKEEKNIIDGLVESMSYMIPGISKHQFNRMVNNKKQGSLISKKNKLTQKFYYQYGFKNIKMGYRSFSNKSIYVSKPFGVDTNVKEVGLNANIDIPKIEGKEVGAVHFYVTNRENPSGNQWHPILAEEQSSNVKSEPVSLDGGVGELRFKPTINSLKVYNNQNKNEEIKDFNINGREIVVNQSLTNVVYCDYTIDSSTNPYIVDFDKVASPIEYIENNKLGQNFKGNDKDNSIKLKNFPYIDYTKISQNLITPDSLLQSFEQFDKNYLLNNNNVYTYNPNYNQGYMPLNISSVGDYDVFDTEIQATVTEYGEIFNDQLGLEFESNYYNEETENIQTINRYEDVYLQYIPYFFNKTDYLRRETPALSQYDTFTNPVYEYSQSGKKIFFNKNIDSKINVRYKYLVEDIRVKVVIYKYTQDNITPVVKDYLLKSRDFQYHPGGF